MGLTDEVPCLFVNACAVCGLSARPEIALNGCNGRAHFVAGGANKFGLFALFGFFFGDIAKYYNTPLPQAVLLAKQSLRRRIFLPECVASARSLVFISLLVASTWEIGSFAVVSSPSFLSRSFNTDL